MRRRAALPLLALTVSAPLVLSGCVERRLRVTSEPPGALVWLNDTEVGRTPVEANFVYHGEYDVRLKLDGYEPISTSRTARAPWYEYPGADLLAAAYPGTLENTQHWHFKMEPVLESTGDRAAFETGLTERARTLRDQLSPAQTPALTEDEVLAQPDGSDG